MPRYDKQTLIDAFKLELAEARGDSERVAAIKAELAKLNEVETAVAAPAPETA